MTDVMTIWRTAQLLISLPEETDLTFDAEDLILYRSRSFTEKTQVYLTDLVCNAQRVAFRSYTANVLVGASNEGSETGDVGIWLGDGEYGQGNEEKVLKTLGLPDSCLTTLEPRDEPALMKELKAESTTMKELKAESTTMKELKAKSTTMKELKAESTTMKDEYCFSVDVEAREGRRSTGYVFFFYIGAFEDGWGGLVAAGVWT